MRKREPMPDLEQLKTEEETGHRTGRSDQTDLVELLHSRGQRVTSQRLVILRELRRRRQHATAEEVHRAVQHELPGVSVPTIYATLDLFVELGLARRIDTATAALYDAGLEPHQHAVCRRCGRVEDVEGRLSAAALIGAARASGFEPQGAELIITGLCAECAAAESTSAQASSQEKRAPGSSEPAPSRTA